MDEVKADNGRPTSEANSPKTGRRRKTNPNGANAVVVDPRQALFFSYYFNPKSETFSNALQSALQAGYSEGYAKNLMDTMPAWLGEKMVELNRAKMLQTAENNLLEIMELPSKVQAMGAFGPLFEQGKQIGTRTRRKKNKETGEMEEIEEPVYEKIPVMVYASPLLKVKNDASKFVAERLGRKQYAQKLEVETLPPKITDYENLSDEELDREIRRLESEIGKRAVRVETQEVNESAEVR